MANNDKVPELSINEFEGFIRDGVVLINFFAEWCMPCLMMAPVIDELSERFKGKIKFGKINVNENESLAHKFNVSSIPNLIVFKEGEVIDRFIGSITEHELQERLNNFI